MHYEMVWFPLFDSTYFGKSCLWSHFLNQERNLTQSNCVVFPKIMITCFENPNCTKDSKLAQERREFWMDENYPIWMKIKQFESVCRPICRRRGIKILILAHQILSTW